MLVSGVQQSDSVYIRPCESLSHVWLFVTLWTERGLVILAYASPHPMKIRNCSKEGHISPCLDWITTRQVSECANCWVCNESFIPWDGAMVLIPGAEEETRQTGNSRDWCSRVRQIPCEAVCAPSRLMLVTLSWMKWYSCFSVGRLGAKKNKLLGPDYRSSM